MSKYKFISTLQKSIRKFNPLLYLRELSVVIIGIAITFFFSDIISKSKEKKDLNTQLSIIYDELEENLQAIDMLIVHYDKHLKLRYYLNQYMEHPDENYADSVQLYSSTAFNSEGFYYKRAAYEMFINSGMMKAVEDRQLLLSITESYLKLEAVKQEHETHLELKYNEYTKLYSKLNKKFLITNEIDITNPLFENILIFHTVNTGIGESVKKVKKQIEKTLEQR